MLFKARLKDVSEGICFKHLLKYAAKLSDTQEFYYPFAEHPRFKFWAYDRLRRHRSLEQSKIYMQQNVDQANLTIAELKALINSGDSNKFMKQMCAYAANITGSDSYWFNRRCELEATFEQKESATCFYTFSYADNHWHDLHRLMPGKPAERPADRYLNVLKNPHLVDWYFGFRLNAFLKVFFDEILGSVWRWHRYILFS